MRRYLALAVALAALLCGLFGCGLEHVQNIPAIESNLNANTTQLTQQRQELKAIESRVAELQGKLTAAEKMAEKERTPLLSNQAKLVSGLERMQADLTALSARVDENRHYLEQMGKRVEALGTLETKVAALEKSLAESQARLTKLSESPRAPYEEGIGLYKAGKYAEARARFQDYLKANPEGELVPNARFWIADSLFAEKKFDEAIVGYQDMIEKHPGSEKVPAALLKQAMAFQELGEAGNARFLFEKLVEKYPKTQQGELAQKALNEMKAAEPESREPPAKNTAKPRKKR